MRIPGRADHHVIVGRNGSGKTQSAAYFLSRRDFNLRPWYIINSKGDELLNRLPGAIDCKLGEFPKKPGLYMYRPIAEVDDEQVDALLWQIYNKRNAGLYADEGYSLPNPSSGLNALLTQGRSRHISCMILSQRPVWLTRFVWSEANFIQCFDLSTDDDIKTMQKTLRVKLAELPPYHSYYLDTKARETVILSPCPDEAEILDTFDHRRMDRRRVAFI
jgi:hypothetical protein